MSEQLYRKKALSKINSPEELNDIICVVNPGVWIILTALVVLLLGACCWGFFGEIETTIPVNFLNVGGRVFTRMPIDDTKDIHVGTPVRVGQNMGSVTEIHYYEENDVAEVDVNMSFVSYLDTVSGEIITEYIHPVELIFN